MERGCWDPIGPGGYKGLTGGDTEELERLWPEETPVGSNADSRDDVTPTEYEELGACSGGDGRGGEVDRMGSTGETSRPMEFSMGWTNLNGT
jgi:hypothetical protein